MIDYINRELAMHVHCKNGPIAGIYITSELLTPEHIIKVTSPDVSREKILQGKPYVK